MAGVSAKLGVMGNSAAVARLVGVLANAGE